MCLLPLFVEVSCCQYCQLTFDGAWWLVVGVAYARARKSGRRGPRWGKTDLVKKLARCGVASFRWLLSDPITEAHPAFPGIGYIGIGWNVRWADSYAL